MPSKSSKQTQMPQAAKEEKLPGSLSSHPAVKPHPEHHFKLIVTLAVIAALIVLGYWLYEYVYWAPERAFTRVGNYVSGLNSYVSERSLSQASGENKNSILANGSYRAKSGANNPYVELMRQVGVGSFGKPVFIDSAVTFDASQKAEGSEFSEEGELRSLDSTYYIKFDTLPALLGDFLKQHKGKWYKTKVDCLLGQSETEMLDAFIKEQKFVGQTERLKKQKGETRRFKGQLNKSAVIAVIEKENELQEEKCKKKAEDLAEIREQINESIGNITVTIVMSRQSYSVTLEFNMAIADKNYDVVSTETFSEFNQGGGIEAPGGAEQMPNELQFVVALLFGGPAALDLDLSGGPTEFEQTPPPSGGPSNPPSFTPPPDYFYQAPPSGQQGSSSLPPDQEEEPDKIAGLIDRPEALPENPIV